MGVWSDVGVLGGEFVTMVGDSSGAVQFRRWNDGDQQLISQVSFGRTAAQYRMCVAGGRCYAVAQVGDRIDECMVIRDDGKTWGSGESASGVNCVSIRPTSRGLDVLWVRRGGGTFARAILSPDLQLIDGPLVEVIFEPTSQGLLGFFDDGRPIFTDEHVPRRFGNRATGYLWHRDQHVYAFQEDGHPERVSALVSDNLFLVAEAHTEAPPRVAVVNGEPLVAIGGHDWFVHRKHFTPWTPPNTAPAPAPVPQPEPEPMPVPMPSHDEILAAVRAAKAQLEAEGVVFSTPEAMAAYYAQHETIPDADKRRAFTVTVRAAWALGQRYPEVGLEAYSGPSAVDGYSFDIILLSKSGPSCDVMAAGVTPAAQIDDSTDPAVKAAWVRDWRPLVVVGDPSPTPAPLPEPAPLPSPGNTDAIVSLLNELNAKMNVLAELAGATADAVQEIRERPDPALPAIEFPEYETRIFGSAVTLRPKR